MAVKSEKIKVESSKVGERVANVLADLTFPVRRYSAEHYPIHFEVDGNIWRVFKSHVDAATKKLICETIKQKMTPPGGTYLSTYSN